MSEPLSPCSEGYTCISGYPCPYHTINTPPIGDERWQQAQQRAGKAEQARAASVARFRDDGTGDWLTFGTHAAPVECKDEPLEFAGYDEGGMPLWERHDDCLVVLGFCDKCQQNDVVIDPEAITEHVSFCFDCTEQAKQPKVSSSESGEGRG